MSENYIGDEGAEALSEGLKWNRTLTSLDLSSKEKINKKEK